MKIKTRIKYLALMIIANPFSVARASDLNTTALAGVVVPESPLIGLSDTLGMVLNYLLIPLAILVIIFYFFKKSNKITKENEKRFIRLGFSLMLILLVVSLVVRALLFIANYFDWFLPIT